VSFQRGLDASALDGRRMGRFIGAAFGRGGAIMEPLASTRDRTNVYVNLWRRLGDFIGDGRFAFILYEYL
jgi:hypothetical protein